MTVQSSLVQTDVDLAPYNTLNVHAKASHFAVVKTVDELKEILDGDARDRLSIFVLGGGSNVLFVNDFNGLIIKVSIPGRNVVKENKSHVWLKAGAGENWHEIVRYCVKKGWGGVENLSLIPGTVGAAPVQNIGAYGVELQDVLEQLSAVALKSGERRIFTNQECQFGYRNSIFKHKYKHQFVVTDITMKLAKDPELNTSYGAIRDKLSKKKISAPTIADISDIVMEIRNNKLPNPEEIANAGSFFKNPIISSATFNILKKEYPSLPGYMVNKNNTKVPAGWLIEKAGWKGREIGHVGTYRQQALVIVNHGGASGQEILNVAKQIQQSVVDKFDLELEPEVNIINAFTG